MSVGFGVVPRTRGTLWPGKEGIRRSKKKQPHKGGPSAQWQDPGTQVWVSQRHSLDTPDCQYRDTVSELASGLDHDLVPCSVLSLGIRLSSVLGWPASGRGDRLAISPSQRGSSPGLL
ncbi:hypothetical protein O3P69_006214 [Scylla paramamosain]|uniref:Uncharacterized protein n=1 Tax=Scylla paramamosain TaxID=85552 RepID=A0AAW0U5R8_SCYPA